MKWRMAFHDDSGVSCLEVIRGGHAKWQSLQRERSNEVVQAGATAQRLLCLWTERQWSLCVVCTKFKDMPQYIFLTLYKSLSFVNVKQQF